LTNLAKWEISHATISRTPGILTSAVSNTTEERREDKSQQSTTLPFSAALPIIYSVIINSYEYQLFSYGRPPSFSHMRPCFPKVSLKVKIVKHP
jgi:hypothetical protein